MKIQVLSDLHLEISSNQEYVNKMVENRFVARGDFLALCGDIGNPFTKVYKDFLQTMSKKFKRVFVVCGNHEFYNNEMNAVVDRVDKLCSLGFENITFLNNSSYLYKKMGIRFVGGTLWTTIPEDKKKIIGHSINDYKHIKYDDKYPEYTKEQRLDNLKSKDYKTKLPAFTVDMCCEKNKKTVQYIKSEIAVAKEKGETVVVCTHHAPLWECLQKEDDFIGDGFANKLDDMLKDDTIQLWLHGHTHASKYIRKGDMTVVYSNQFGYQFNSQMTDFKDNQFISLYSKKGKNGCKMYS